MSSTCLAEAIDLHVERKSFPFSPEPDSRASFLGQLYENISSNSFIPLVTFIKDE